MNSKPPTGSIFWVFCIREFSSFSHAQSIFAGENISNSIMQLARTSTARRLFVGIVSFNVCLLIYLLIPTWTMQTDDNTPTECEDFNTHLHQLEVPLLCMFTTFKPKTAKNPVGLNRGLCTLLTDAQINGVQNCERSLLMHPQLWTFSPATIKTFSKRIVQCNINSSMSTYCFSVTKFHKYIQLETEK